jgi:uncharacterized protein YbaR (Trm112 family)
MNSKNDRAKKLMGLRPIGEVLNPNFSFICPVCQNALQLSEYNNFLWCKYCNIDMPIYLGWKVLLIDDVKAITKDFLNLIENIKKNPSIANYMENIRSKTSLAYCIISILEKEGEIEFRKFRFLLFELYSNLKTKNIDIKLPHYWYVDGPHIYLRGLPAVFKLRIKKSLEDPKIYKVTILLDKNISPKCIEENF